MNKFWVKAIAFVVIIGLLIILGSREMKKRGINQYNFSPFFKWNVTREHAK